MEADGKASSSSGKLHLRALPGKFKPGAPWLHQFNKMILTWGEVGRQVLLELLDFYPRRQEPFRRADLQLLAKAKTYDKVLFREITPLGRGDGRAGRQPLLDETTTVIDLNGVEKHGFRHLRDAAVQELEDTKSSIAHSDSAMTSLPATPAIAATDAAMTTFQRHATRDELRDAFTHAALNTPGGRRSLKLLMDGVLDRAASPGTDAATDQPGARADQRASEAHEDLAYAEDDLEAARQRAATCEAASQDADTKLRLETARSNEAERTALSIKALMIRADKKVAAAKRIATSAQEELAAAHSEAQEASAAALSEGRELVSLAREHGLIDPSEPHADAPQLQGATIGQRRCYEALVALAKHVEGRGEDQADEYAELAFDALGSLDGTSHSSSEDDSAEQPGRDPTPAAGPGTAPASAPPAAPAAPAPAPAAAQVSPGEAIPDELADILTEDVASDDATAATAAGDAADSSATATATQVARLLRADADSIETDSDAQDPGDGTGGEPSVYGFELPGAKPAPRRVTLQFLGPLVTQHRVGLAAACAAHKRVAELQHQRLARSADHAQAEHQADEVAQELAKAEENVERAGVRVARAESRSEEAAEEVEASHAELMNRSRAASAASKAVQDIELSGRSDLFHADLSSVSGHTTAGCDTSLVDATGKFYYAIRWGENDFCGVVPSMSIALKKEQGAPDPSAFMVKRFGRGQLEAAKEWVLARGPHPRDDPADDLDLSLMHGDQTNIYAVALGKGGFCGLLSSWDECKRLVRGVSGCSYKKFGKGQRAQAIAYVRKHTTTPSSAPGSSAGPAAPAGRSTAKRVTFSGVQVHKFPPGVPLVGAPGPAPAPSDSALFGFVGMDSYGRVVSHNWLSDVLRHGIEDPEVVHPQAMIKFVKIFCDESYQRVVTWLDGEHEDLVKACAMGDGLALIDALNRHYTVRTKSLASRLRQELLNIKLGAGTRSAPLASGFELFSGFLTRLYNLERLLEAATPVGTGPFNTPVTDDFLSDLVDHRLPSRYGDGGEPSGLYAEFRRVRERMAAHQEIATGAAFVNPSTMIIPFSKKKTMIAAFESGKLYGSKTLKEWVRPPKGYRRKEMANGAIFFEPINGGQGHANLVVDDLDHEDHAMELDPDTNLPTAWSTASGGAHSAGRGGHPDENCHRCGKPFNPDAIDPNGIHKNCFSDGTGRNDLCMFKKKVDGKVKHDHSKPGKVSGRRHLHRVCNLRKKDEKRSQEQGHEAHEQPRSRGRGDRDRSRDAPSDKPRLDASLMSWCKFKKLCFYCGGSKCFQDCMKAGASAEDLARKKEWTETTWPKLKPKVEQFLGDDAFVGSATQPQRPAAPASDGPPRTSTVTITEYQASACEPALTESEHKVTNNQPSPALLFPLSPCREAGTSEGRDTHDASREEGADPGESAFSSWMRDLATKDRQRAASVREWASPSTADAKGGGAKPSNYQDIVIIRPRVPDMMRAADGGAQTGAKWEMDTQTPITMGEILEQRDCLFVVLSVSKPDGLNNLQSSAWLPGHVTHLLCAPNTQLLRVPRRGRHGEVVGLGDARADLTLAMSRMRRGDYTRMIIRSSLPKACRVDGGDSDTYASLIADLTMNRHAPRDPDFMADLDAASLLRRHDQSTGRSLYRPSLLSVCCGISGDGLAWEASGCDPKRMVFVTCCPEDTAILERRYPLATIIQADVRDPRLSAVLADAARAVGGIDISMVAVLCQPSSDAATVHDPNDARLAIGMLAVDLGIDIAPKMLLVENVSSMRRRQPAAYNALKLRISKSFPAFFARVLDARLCLSPSRRNRLFMIGHPDLDLSPMVAACKQQAILERSGEYKSVSVLDGLRPYRPDAGKIKGIFIPHLKRCKHDSQGRPRRIASSDRTSTCITTRWGKRGGLSQEALRRYRPHDVDEAHKQDTICLTPQEVGVVLGFSMWAPWSDARACPLGPCVGCSDKHGRHRGIPGELQRGNVIIPQHLFFLTRFLIPELRRSMGVDHCPSADCGGGCSDVKLPADNTPKAFGGSEGERSPTGGDPPTFDQGTAVGMNKAALWALHRPELEVTSRNSHVRAWSKANPIANPTRRVRFADSCTGDHTHTAHGSADPEAATANGDGDTGDCGTCGLDATPYSAGGASDSDADATESRASGGVNEPDPKDNAPDAAGVIGASNHTATGAASSTPDRVWACLVADAEARADAICNPGHCNGFCLSCSCASDAPDELAEAVGRAMFEFSTSHTDSTVHSLCRARARGAEACRSKNRDHQLRASKRRPWCKPPPSLSRAHALMVEEWATPVVSDEEAEVKLRLLHQRMGHASLKFLKKLHDSGELLGFNLSADQFACIQFFCPTCAKARGTKKAHSKHRASGPPRRRILERVYVDVAGPRRAASLHYTGKRGNQSGGGNYYTVFYLDAATERGFTSFIRTKDELESNVRHMRAHLTMQARDSIEFNGTDDIKVKAFASDRDSNLTSDEAVADMLAASIHHRMTSSDGKNQTPFLDGLIRRVQDTTRCLLRHSGLPLEYWEFAETVAMSLVNCLPSKRHRQHHSPMHRWTGRKQDLSRFKTFGADAYVHLEPHERENGDKLDPVFAGGDGTYRYMGPEEGVGYDGMGDLILNTKTCTLSSRRNTKLDEDMERVSELALPSPRYPKLKTLSENVPIDPGFSTKFIDHSPDGNSDLDVPIECKPAIGGEETSPRLPDPRTIVKTRGGIKKPSPSRPAKVGRLTPLGDDQPIMVSEVNPKQQGKKCRDRYEKYKTAKTVGEMLRLGGTRADLRHDLKKGFILLLPPGETAASVPSCPGWLAPQRALSVAHASTAREWAHYALNEYAQNAREYMKKRAESDQHVPEGLCEADRLLPIWEAYSSSESTDFIDSSLSAVHTLSREFANWHRYHNTFAAASSEMQAVTDMAEEIFSSMRRGHHANLVKELAHIRRSDVPTPKRFSDAIKGEFKVYWLEAIEKEIENLREHHVFEWVPKPPGKHLIDSNWAWKVKANDKGQISKFKARLVARGFRQIYGVDYIDTMSPVGKLTTFRALIAEAARRGMEFAFVDIRSAYLEAELKIKQYMSPPKGVTPPQPGMVMRLDRGLYGLKQSGKRWHEKFKKNLIDWGFTPSSADPCLFVKRQGQSQVRVLLFVDDMAIFHDSDEGGTKLKEELIQAVKTHGYEYSSSDDDNVYLGMAVSRINNTCLRLSQERYIEEVMIKFDFDKCDKVWSPSKPGHVTVLDCASCKPEDNPRGRRFREMTGALRWIEQCTRPDISATLSELSKVQLNPGDDHVERLEHLMRYVSTTRNLSLVYGGPDRGTLEGTLTCVTDADWAGDKDTYYSRGGHLHLMWGTPVSWQSQKMKAIAASSCESEYMAASRAVRESLWLRYLVSDLGYGDLTTSSYGKFCDKDFIKLRLSRLIKLCDKAIIFLGDNKGAIALSKNPVLHKRSKHIHVAYHIVRRMVQAGHCTFCYVPTKENIADLMTKGLPASTHEYLVNKIMFSRHDDGLADYRGKLIPFDPRPITRDTLYSSEPLGLNPGKFDNVFPEQPSLPSKWPKGPLTVTGMDPADRFDDQMLPKGWGAPRSAPAVAASAVGSVSRAIRTLTRIARALSANGGTQYAALVRKLYAIIDSGASYTYVGGDRPLSHERSGAGFVSVANGQREEIAGRGWYGPISSARRVASFPRDLVSASDIIEQFGFTVFDREGVYVVSSTPSGRDVLMTRIGTRTPDRLFSFDKDALSKHAEGMKLRGMDPSTQGNAMRWLNTMGVRESPTGALQGCGASHRQACHHGGSALTAPFQTTV